jgi:tol-pal system protein YbgF
VSYVLISRRSLGAALAILLVAPLWIQSSWARNYPAPVYDASGVGNSGPTSDKTSGTSIEARLSRLENKTMLDLMERMDKLQDEVQRMLGELEEQAHNMESLNKRQRDIYLDIDQRLSKIEKGNVAAPAMGAFVPAPASVSIGTPSTSATNTVPSGNVNNQATASAAVGNSRQERIDYEKAFGLLKDRHYDRAAKALKFFVKSYPAGQYAGNAQYWLGEANYVQHNFKLALEDFDKVVKNYVTSPKRADAMLKMGYTYQELGQLDEARLSLSDVSKNYPNSTAANLAQKRLQDIKRLH